MLRQIVDTNPVRDLDTCTMSIGRIAHWQACLRLRLPTSSDKANNKPRASDSPSRNTSQVGACLAVQARRPFLSDDHTITVSGKRLTGEKILIASGSRPVAPGIEGLDQVPYLTSDLLTNEEPMELWSS